MNIAELGTATRIRVQLSYQGSTIEIEAREEWGGTDSVRSGTGLGSVPCGFYTPGSCPLQLSGFSRSIRCVARSTATRCMGHQSCRARGSTTTCFSRGLDDPWAVIESRPEGRPMERSIKDNGSWVAGTALAATGGRGASCLMEGGPRCGFDSRAFDGSPGHCPFVSTRGRTANELCR